MNISGDMILGTKKINIGEIELKPTKTVLLNADGTPIITSNTSTNNTYIKKSDNSLNGTEQLERAIKLGITPTANMFPNKIYDKDLLNKVQDKLNNSDSIVRSYPNNTDTVEMPILSGGYQPNPNTSDKIQIDMVDVPILGSESVTDIINTDTVEMPILSGGYQLNPNTSDKIQIDMVDVPILGPKFVTGTINPDTDPYMPLIASYPDEVSQGTATIPIETTPKNVNDAFTSNREEIGNNDVKKTLKVKGDSIYITPAQEKYLMPWNYESVSDLKVPELKDFVKESGKYSNLNTLLQSDDALAPYTDLTTSKSVIPMITGDTKNIVAASTVVKKEAVNSMKTNDTRSILNILSKNKDIGNSFTNSYTKNSYPAEDKRSKNVMPGKYLENLSMKVGHKPLIQIYPDKSLQLKSNSGNTTNYNKFIDSGIKYIDCFVLTSVGINSSEKLTKFSPLGDAPDMFWFFGAHVKEVRLTGNLLNSDSQEWRNDFMYYYDNYLRGTIAVKNRTKTALVFEDLRIEGYFITSSINEGSRTPNLLSLELSVIVTKVTPISGWVNPIDRTRSKVTITKQPFSPAEYAVKHSEELLNNLKSAGVSYLDIITSSSGIPNVKKFLADGTLPKKVIEDITAKQNKITDRINKTTAKPARIIQDKLNKIKKITEAPNGITKVLDRINISDIIEAPIQIESRIKELF